MIRAESFAASAARAGFGLYTGVPCSFLKPLINLAIDDPGLRYVAAANEGDAVAIASGAQLAGTPAIAIFQNSGLGNAVNPLTSLNHAAKIPILLVVTLRGDPDTANDEPQHQLMGRITGDMLSLMEIAWDYFPDDERRLADALDRAVKHMTSTNRPYALVMRKGSVEPRPLQTTPDVTQWRHEQGAVAAAVASRREMLNAVLAAAGPRDAIVATTGYTGRELFALDDRPANFYMVGSMGCASSIGLGVALARPNRRVLVLDGDGALIMRLGAMTTTGQCHPSNLTHILLDNSLHESTGGQATASSGVDFCAIAAACGYAEARSVSAPPEMTELLESGMPGPAFIRARIKPGAPADLPRPDHGPADVAERFRRFMDDNDGTASAAS